MSRRANSQRQRPPSALLRPRDVMARLGVSSSTLSRWRHQSPPHLPYIDLGGGTYRYREADLNAFVAGRLRGAVAPVTSGTVSEAAQLLHPDEQAEYEEALRSRIRRR